jgi:LCP family protein required for cell wall assembly
VSKRSIITGVAVGVVTAGLAVGGLLLFDTPDTRVTPTTTSEGIAATSTTAASTTTTEPPTEIIVRFDTSGDLETAVAGFFAWIGNRQLEPPPMSDGVADCIADVRPTQDVFMRAEAAQATIEIAEALLDEQFNEVNVSIANIGVAVAGGNVVLAVDDGAGWRIVGAKLGLFGAQTCYGEPVRMVMVIGTDARPGQAQPVFRADSLHILTSVIGERTGNVVGIPRDSLVEVPYGGTDKLTHVNVYAGTDALVDVVGELSGLELEGYLITGFLGFEQLVNEFGGVEVEVPFSMAEPKSGAYLSAGLQRLWGANALAFSRNRTLPGLDFTRSYHQGLVIIGALHGVQTRDILELPALVDILTAYTWSDLSAEDLLTLAAGAFEIETVQNVVLPGSIGTSGGASVVFLDPLADDIFADLADGILTVDVPLPTD